MIIGAAPKSIFIGIPAGDGWVHHGLLAFITALGQLAPKKHFIFQVVANKRPVEYARNVIVRDFLTSGADALWFIDADQAPYLSAVRMLDTRADIVSGFTVGACPPLPEDPGRITVSWNIRPSDTPEELGSKIDPEQMSGTRDIALAGTGCLLISRRVLEDERMHFGPKDLSGVPAVFRTLYNANGHVSVGEDFDFCRRARDLGYSLRVNMDARFGHNHVIDLMELIGKGRGTDPGPEVSLIHAV